jgi:mono/diheme cytochrome c family protein
MLSRIDKPLALVSWVFAAILVVMLLFGPAVIANDDNSPGAAAAGAAMYGKKAGANGPKVFQANCGTCHTLKAAGTNGQVGPNLDKVSLSASDIESIVRSGSGAMPSFDGRLSGAEISAVAAFVEAAR